MKKRRFKRRSERGGDLRMQTMKVTWGVAQRAGGKGEEGMHKGKRRALEGALKVPN